MTEESNTNQPDSEYVQLIEQMAEYYKSEFANTHGRLNQEHLLEIKSPESIVPIMEDLVRLARQAQELFVRLGIYISLNEYAQRNKNESQFVTTGEATKPSHPHNI
jgi:hypothetical protein